MNRKDQVFALEANKLYSAFGISKRELFAAFALAGFCADKECDGEMAAVYALEAADEMMALLADDQKSKTKEPEYCEHTGYVLGG